MKIIGNLRGVYKGISCQTIKQLYILCAGPIFEYTSPVWYHKPASQWKDGIQEVQNTELHKILRAFKFVPFKEMQRDAEMLPVNIRIEEIRDQFSIRDIRDVSSKSPIWKLANLSKPAESDLEKFLDGFRQMNVIDDDRYWSKYPPWKLSKHDRDMKPHKTLRKLKKILHVASRG